MTNLHASSLVGAMVPRYELEEGTSVEIVSRDEFSGILRAAMENDEFGAIGISTFCCDKEYGYKAIGILSIHEVSPNMRERWLEYRRQQRERAPTPEKQHEIDMSRADRAWRRISRRALEKIGVEPPHFLMTNWRVYDRIRTERVQSRERFLSSGDLITYRDNSDKKVWYVAADSEARFQRTA
jgi:hypothetical protein